MFEFSRFLEESERFDLIFLRICWPHTMEDTAARDSQRFRAHCVQKMYLFCEMILSHFETPHGNGAPNGKTKGAMVLSAMVCVLSEENVLSFCVLKRLLEATSSDAWGTAVEEI